MSTLQSLAPRMVSTKALAITGAVDAMLNVAEPLQDTQVMVIGHETIEALCALIGRGYGAATEMAIGGWLPTDRAEIGWCRAWDRWMKPRMALALARRVLLPCGRIVMHDTDSLLAEPIICLLRSTGFSVIRARISPHGTIVSDDWQMFGQNAGAVHA